MYIFSSDLFWVRAILFCYSQISCQPSKMTVIIFQTPTHLFIQHERAIIDFEEGKENQALPILAISEIILLCSFVRLEESPQQCQWNWVWKVWGRKNKMSFDILKRIRCAILRPERPLWIYCPCFLTSSCLYSLTYKKIIVMLTSQCGNKGWKIRRYQSFMITHVQPRLMSPKSGLTVFRLKRSSSSPVTQDPLF